MSGPASTNLDMTYYFSGIDALALSETLHTEKHLGVSCEKTGIWLGFGTPPALHDTIYPLRFLFSSLCDIFLELEGFNGLMIQIVKPVGRWI